MNFGSGAGGGGAGGGNGSVNTGPDLEEVETEHFSFQAASGEDKLRLLPSPWPTDNFPQTTASLLSVASSKGLVAAASPDTLVLASTESLRQTYLNGTADADKVKAFTPQATIPVPRVSQVAFSSDENCLVIAAEQGGGLAVYDTNALLSGSKEPAFQLGTEGQSVRQLLPNPNPESSRYFGIVTTSGALLLADLQEQKLVNSSSGSAIFHQNVSCACWSRLGKQIIAGLADGTAVQIDQQGVVKATIPEPPQLAQLKDPGADSCPITSIYWLETFDFLLIHTPINSPDSMGQDDSFYHLAHKDKTTQTWTFSKFMDPCPPFGLERKPAHHFVQRLRDWPPTLTDTLVLASTASTDIGVFTRAKQPLNPERPVTDTYTYTLPPDQRRAAMQMGAAGDTSPIGLALDLSPKERISRPIPTEETLDESPIPLPALYVLSNEGTLSIWWVVYNDAIRQQQPYPDLIAAGGPRSLSDKPGAAASAASLSPATSSPFGATSSNATAPASSPFGGMSSAAAPASATKSTFGQTSSFGQASPLGSTNTSTFGKPATSSTFGGSSALGSNQSPWGKPAAPATSTFGGGGGGSTFGQSSFGQARPPSSSGAFGQAGGLGQSKSPWAASQPPAQSPLASGGGGSIFGGNASKASPFTSTGNSGESPTAQSPFAAFAKKEHQPSPFGAKPSLSAEPSGSTVSFGTGTSFGSGSSAFGGQQTPSAFGTPTPAPAFSSFGKPSTAAPSKENSMQDVSSKPADSENKSPFGLPAGGFKLGSTFKGDGSAKDDLPKPKDPGAGFFGSTFGNALGDTSKQASSIKKEPGTEEQPKLNDIPEARSRSATPKPAPKESAKADDAPLPPDPMTWKPKPDALPPPIPPGFGADFGKPKDADAPLPPDFLSSKQPADASLPPGFVSKASGESEKPVAGSPPVDLGNETFSSGIGSGEEGPPEDDDEEGFTEDEDEEDEGDENDEENETAEIEDPKGLAAFKSRITPASPRPPPKSPESPETKESTTPATEKKKDSYTPAGLPKAPIMFAPPTKNVQESPRSPSPVRSATSPQRLMAQPFGASRSRPPPSPAGGSSRQSSQSAMRPPSMSQGPPQRISVPPAQLVSQDPHRPKASPRPSEPDAGQLEDEEDARIQQVLAAPVEPTREVPSFLAHQDYVGIAQKGDSTRAGLGGQIERVFRDVNSMVDTLALNARGMQGFVQGNEAGQNGQSKDREDLDEVEEWGLGEAEDLQKVIGNFEEDLDREQLRDVQGTVQGLRDEEGETNRLRTRVGEVKKQIAARSDPDRLRDQLLSPLPMESAAQQSEVRQGVQKVQSLLAKAEEQLSLLRAELASHQQQNGATAAVPTLEAVTNTILKMTAMIEKRSGDVDVLESSIRRMGGLPSSALTDGYEDNLAGAMKASRLSYSSPTPASALRRSAMKSSRLGASRGTPGSARKSLMQVDDEDVEAYRARKEARRKVCEVLRDDVLGNRSPRVVKVRDL